MPSVGASVFAECFNSADMSNISSTEEKKTSQIASHAMF